MTFYKTRVLIGWNCSKSCKGVFWRRKKSTNESTLYFFNRLYTINLTDGNHLSFLNSSGQMSHTINFPILLWWSRFVRSEQLFLSSAFILVRAVHLPSRFIILFFIWYFIRNAKLPRYLILSWIGMAIKDLRYF